MSEPVTSREARVGFLGGTGPTPPDAPDRLLFAPGRARLELSVLLAAVALLFPVSAFGAMAAALLARRSGHQRWSAALVAGLWCGLLGVAVRASLGLATFP